VWTTNYDTLIEEAAAAHGLPMAVAVSTLTPSPGRASLIKVHGSLHERPTDEAASTNGPGPIRACAAWTGATPLLYTAPPLIAGLPPAARQRLQSDVNA
jgi:hypothetical protein